MATTGNTVTQLTIPNTPHGDRVTVRMAVGTPHLEWAPVVPLRGHQETLEPSRLLESVKTADGVEVCLWSRGFE
jgi:hypothetical protein